jgi:hypothetical protein
MHPYFFELRAEERRNELLRGAEAWRIAHTTAGRATGANPWWVRLFPWGRRAYGKARRASPATLPRGDPETRCPRAHGLG